MAINYVMLYHITGQEAYREAVENMFASISNVISSPHNIYYSSITYAWLLLHVGGKLTVKQGKFRDLTAKFRSNLYFRENTQGDSIQVCQGNI